MKILFYNHTGQVSGAERVLHMILAGLDRDRFDCVVACPEASRMMKLTDDAGVRTRGLRSLEARFTGRPDRLVRYLVSFMQVISEARAVVIEESPDAIHANSIRAGIVMAAATIGLHVPVIWHAHDILPRHPLSTVVRLFAATSSRNTILAVSQAVADRFRGLILRRFAKRVPVAVIHNAVDLERFHRDEKARAETRNALGLHEVQPVIGIVGQLTPRKGQLELINAFAHVARLDPASVLLIAGEPLFNRDEEYADELKQSVEALGISGAVRFLGPRSDVPALMQALDVLVINSHEEPFALTVLEGLASGIAVLATSVGGTPEMVRHGENGWLVPPRDVHSLARALFLLLQSDELRNRLRRNARQSAVDQFSTQRYLRAVTSMYSSLEFAKPANIPRHRLDKKLATD